MFHRLLAPSLAYSLGLAFAAMADAIVIGWQMGVTGLAALCFSLPLHTMLLAFVHGLGLGGSTRYARLLAEGKPAQATDCFNRILPSLSICSRKQFWSFWAPHPLTAHCTPPPKAICV